MKTLAAILAIAAATPAAARDGYSGYWTRDCGGTLQCDLRISPAGRDKWHVRFEAMDRRDPSNTPVCAAEARVAEGEAAIADMIVTGIPVGRLRGKPFALFEGGGVTVTWSGRVDACPGIGTAGIYGAVGD